MQTSLIINTYNQPRSLPLVFESIAGQSHSVDEILIADDGSRRETFEVIERCQARFNLPIKEIVTQENKGYRKGRILNKAASRSSGQQLVFMDGDIIAPPRWVGRHIQSYRPNGFTTGGYVRLTWAESTKIAEARLNGLKWADFISPSLFSYSSSRRITHCFTVYRKDLIGIVLGKPTRPEIRGGNFSVDRDLFFGVNGFDERYAGVSGVDADLRNRMNVYGGKPTSLVYGTLVLHLHHGLESDEPNPRPNRCKTKPDFYYACSGEDSWATAGLSLHRDALRVE